MSPLLLLIGALLMGVTLLSLFFFCRLQSRIYRTMKAGEPVDVGQNSRRLFFYNVVSLVSWWLASLTNSSAVTVSVVLLSFLKSLLEMLIFFVLSGICVWRMAQYSKKQQ